MPSADTPLNLDSLYLTDVNQHDIWDRRESAVGNAEVWRAACTAYKRSADFARGIPHLIHQIWIGTRQPPCVWLDTWRLDYMGAFEKPSAAQAGAAPWEYCLWDNDSVVDMHMLNRAIFEAESAPQCQADILRLEVLYEYGGVYVDADIVSTVKDMRPAMEAAKETGFLITYEPDTRDKPYSVLGNSLIACTPRHPLILMLMAYIKQVYPHKRAHYGVEWVTGPLTYTKVLIHPGMPVTVPPSKDFYPAFHYIPNPSAIDVTSFDSYCFQFGYTCSGLSQWVAENNTCRQAHDCSYHANIQYPLGKLKQFPKALPPTSPDASIPNVIHQFAFQEPGSRPVRWMETWSEDFCPATGFKYELWTWKRLKEDIGSFFCANLYDTSRMDAFSIRMLALEVLHTFGGYYVPLCTVFVGSPTDPEVASQIFSCAKSGHFESGSIVGFAPESCIAKIRDSYNAGSVSFAEPKNELPSSLVSDMRYDDGIASSVAFKNTSRFLGASEIYYVPPYDANASDKSTAGAVLLWAYDCQVPIFKFEDEQKALEALQRSEKRCVVITDYQFAVHSTLVDHIPGVMYNMEKENVEWEYIILNVEWEVNEDEVATYKASSPFRAPNAEYLGFLVNVGAAKTLHSLNVETLLEQHASGRVHVVSQKSRHPANVAALYRAMPAITHAFRSLADYEPNFSRGDEEVLDNLVKGFRDGRIGFELQVDNEKRVMFRSWGDSGGIDCECKITPGMSGIAVEWLRVYQDQTVAYETTGTFVR